MSYRSSSGSSGHEVANREKLTKLSQSRGGHTTNIKRKLKEFQLAVDGRFDSEIVRSKLAILETAVTHYQEIHEKCVKLASEFDKEKLPKYEEDYHKIKKILNTARDQYVELVIGLKDDVTPDDSASQCSTNISAKSTTSSARAKAAAKRAALLVKAKFLKQQQELELGQLRMKIKMDEELLRQKAAVETLKLESEIGAAEAAEETLAMFMAPPAQIEQRFPVNTDHVTRVPQFQRVSMTSPMASHGAAALTIEQDDDEDGSSQQPAPADVAADVHNVDCLKGNDTRKLNPLAEEWPISPMKQEGVHLALQRQMLDVMNLPKTSLMTFDGDPMKYWVFVNSFDSCVGDSSVSDSAKLNRLFEYCKGKAARVIQPCALMNPSEGYAKARSLLKERFGNDFKISQAWVTKVCEGPVLKASDGEALQDFSDDVSGCMETLKVIGQVNEIDSRVRMVKIVERLPFYMQSRWRTKAVKTMERTGAYPNIDKLAQFLRVAVKEVNDPVFGSLNTKYTDSKQTGKPANHKRMSAFNVQAKDCTANQSAELSKREWYGTSKKDGVPPRPCHVCKEDHRLYACHVFKKMPPHKRMEVVKSKRLCFNCLAASNHVARWCRWKSECGKDGCTRKHSKLLHDAMQFAAERSDQKVLRSEDERKVDMPMVDAKSCMCGPSARDDVKVVLPIVTVNVRGKGQSSYVQTHALLDPGSNKTFCSPALLDQMGLKGEKTTLSLETLNEGSDSEGFEVALELTGTVGKKRKRKVIQLLRVYAIPTFPSLKSCLVTPAEIGGWDHLRDLDLPQVPESDVTILIGQDVPQALIPLEVRRVKDGEPYATRTALGWTVSGPVGEDKCHDKAVCHLIQASMQPEVSLDAQVEQFWKLDTPQMLAGSRPEMSVDDKLVIDIWNHSLMMVEGHYQMDIPFKATPPELPNNRPLAEKRLQSLGRRLAKDGELHGKYKAGIEELVAKGYAEVVPVRDIDTSPGKSWYLPHHNVVNVNKPDKLRIVFDCAAEYAKTSLNKGVMQGPDMTNRLIGVLMRFREHQVAVMGDIEAMFHQVRVSPSHRDALRFLWWKDGNIANQPEVYRMTVHLFGGVWSPSCASYALRRTAEDHKGDFDSETVSTIMENFYVDDCLKAVDDEDDAIHLVKQLCQLLSLGGFRLTKWISNSRRVIESIPHDEQAKGIKGLDLDKASLPVERALGVQWETDTDMFGIKIRPKEKNHTRRGLLSILSSVYDPLGFVCPFVLQAKKIFQDECKKGKAWDDVLDPENLSRWTQWLKELTKLEDFRVPRCIVPRGFEQPLKVQLHHFCDASVVAYGTVSYVRLINEKQGTFHCSFLVGKSRLAPIKSMTIPRLELSAAVMAVRMDSMLRREMRLEVQDTIFWTDSMIVLQYIKNRTKRFHTFVSNRVAIIQDGSLPSQWRYVDTKNNPADDASRGLYAEQMLSRARWKQGPEFLWQDETTWPVEPDASPDLLKDDRELKREAKICAVKEADPEDLFDNLLKRYSCWNRLKKTVAWLVRFRMWLRNHRQLEPQMSIQVHELQAAERVIMQYLQKKHFREEIRTLEVGGKVPKMSAIHSLDPVMGDDGLLRIGGRLQAAPLTERAKHPVIVPREHHVAELIIRHFHERKSAHSGREYVLSLVREMYWIPKARPLINRVLRGCVFCKRLRGKACSQGQSHPRQTSFLPYWS